MSLKQIKRKIKSILLFLITFMILAIALLYNQIDHIFNRRKGNIRYLYNYFPVNFNSSDDLGLQKNSLNGLEIQTNNDNKAKLKIIASKNGIRYYYEHCPGINRIREENMIFFDSEMEAEEAGYTIANNCEK